MKVGGSKKKLKEKIEMHLRSATRKLITFDTVQETLNYLLESFYNEYTCDVVAILLKEDGQLVPKVWKGGNFNIDQIMNLSLKVCSPDLLEYALWGSAKEEGLETCAFADGLKSENIATWFTVPLKQSEKTGYGLCVIGFYDLVPLIIEAEQNFTEFGHDVAVAIELAQEKEEQKRKIKGIEWIKENTFTGSSIESVIGKVVERAIKGTKAQGACIYLYDETNRCFTLTPPIHGTIKLEEKIFIHSVGIFDHYFPSVESSGEHELTVPLLANLKTVGMIYVCHKEGHFFTNEDLKFLKFVSTFVSIQIENARLYQFEYESKRRLEKILNYHQELVKKTVEGQDLELITSVAGSTLGVSILLYDRFLKPITSYVQEDKKHLSKLYDNKILSRKPQITQLLSKELWIEEDQITFSIWPIKSGRDVLGYLVLFLEKEEMDRVLHFTIDYTINVYAIEFIKQKLIIDAREQEKESFVNQLFADPIDDQEKVITYATLINWNISESHRVAVLSMEINEVQEDLIAVEGYKTWLWDQIKTELAQNYPYMIYTRKGDEFILIVKETEERKSPVHYWRDVYIQMKRTVQKENERVQIYLGIGDFTRTIKDYYYSYIKAAKAKNIVSHHPAKEGYAFYDDLGSYTILNNSSDPLAAELFIKKHLAPLIQYSKNNVDLFLTLQVYLQHNGNYREASDELFIHRSTLEYRIERIEDLLNINLSNADIRFELMMAYKLYSLYDFNRSEFCEV